MGNKTKYWTGLEELDQTPEFKEAYENEFPKTQEVDEFLNDEAASSSGTGRRDFLKFMGFSVAAASLAACETPVYKAIPYVNKPEDQIPGVANYYASTFYNGQDYSNILVKTREGRPIFIKANKAFGISGGGINARVNASVLSLYDSARLQTPMSGGKETTWDSIDADVKKALKSNGGQTVLLTNTVISPTAKRAVNEFCQANNAKHVQLDTISYEAIRKANKADFGKAVIPSYDFASAETIVSFDADFLNAWLLGGINHAQYAAGRKLDNGKMSKHYQIEAIMSMTGTNADVRLATKPSRIGVMAAALYQELAKKMGRTAPQVSTDGLDLNAIKAMANDLAATKGKSLVVAGHNNVEIQKVVNAINNMLGNYGNTIMLDKPVHLYGGNSQSVQQLVDDMNGGKVGTLIVSGCNPAYSLPNADKFAAGLAKVKTSVSTSMLSDETASKCSHIAPTHHYLESWNDLNGVGDRIDLVQPTINQLFKTRQSEESWLRWSGNNTPYYEYLRKTYSPSYSAMNMNTDSSWNIALHNGMMTKAAAPVADQVAMTEDEQPENTTTSASVGAGLGAAIGAIQANAKNASGSWEVSFYQKMGIADGSQAANPWLQELPDPVTKITWDNYITMSPMDVDEYGYNRHISEKQYASMATIKVNGKEVNLPVYAQPGQKRGTVGVALGYGRGANAENVGKAAFQTDVNGEHMLTEDGKPMPIGKSVYPMLSVVGGMVDYMASCDIVKIEGEYPMATTQTQHTVMGRDSVVKETNLVTYNQEKSKPRGDASFNEFIRLAVHEDGEAKKVHAIEQSLWEEHPVEQVGHRWGMAIDLSSCTGCGACVTACHIENNVPVVGKDEVRRSRDMHWMRIDRYYSSDMSLEKGEEEGIGTIEAYTKMENPAENPQTVHMPMMCQHCNHAPCETVCPVAATTHSNEGLNQMTYNRCIGTRYCANNCPYKVRRFNWWNYQAYKKFDKVNPSQDSLMRMVLNPDVTVRSRGVMEKCSMCVQRIQEGKLEAKTSGTAVNDGMVVTACAEGCPANAITFGDLNDNKAAVRAKADNVRSYNALEEVGVKPNMYYMTKVRNKA